MYNFVLEQLKIRHSTYRHTTCFQVKYVKIPFINRNMTECSSGEMIVGLPLNKYVPKPVIQFC